MSQPQGMYQFSLPVLVYVYLILSLLRLIIVGLNSYTKNVCTSVAPKVMPPFISMETTIDTNNTIKKFDTANF
jgi:hypothetical protein